MTAILEILTGDLSGRAYDIDEAPFTIGRKDDCAIVLPKRYVSRRHAEIIRNGERWIVRGLSRKNPIVVGKSEVEEKVLADGEVFEICGIQFRFRAQGKGQSKGERLAERASGNHAALAEADLDEDLDKDDLDKEEDAPKKGGQNFDDIEDGPLPGSEASQSIPKAAKQSGSKKSAKDDIEDGPLPGADEESVTEQFDAKASAAKKNANGSAPGGSGSGSGDGRSGYRADPKAGPRGAERVVFDDAPGPAPAKKETGAKKSGSGDEKEERTDQIDVSKLKDDDPFADKKDPRKDPAAIAARERFLKLLVVVGFLGILMSAGALYYITRPPEKQIVNYTELSGQVGDKETRHYEEPLSENNPPLIALVDELTIATGEAQELVRVDDTSVARVEWAVPGVTRTVAHFLVFGQSPGDAHFEVDYYDGSKRVYTVHVAGTSKHKRLEEEWKKSHAAWQPDELRKEIADRLAAGKQFEERGNMPRQELFPRQALHEYERAQLALELYANHPAITQAIDQNLPLLRQNVNDAYTLGKRKWEQAYAQKKQIYLNDLRQASYADAARDLQYLLWTIGDECDGDYQRFRLILEKIWIPKGYLRSFESIGCIKDRP